MAPDIRESSGERDVDLVVHLDFHSMELQSLDLPIEISKLNSVVVKQTFPGRTVKLPPGDYFVTARLPGGQRLVEHVKLADVPTIVKLKPEAGDRSPHEWQEAPRFLAARRTVRRGAVGESNAAMAAPAAGLAFVRVFAGNPFEQLAPIAPESVLQLRNVDRGQIVVFGAASIGQRLLLQLFEPGEVPRNMILPVGEGPSPAPTVVFERVEDGAFKMEVQLAHCGAELLLRASARQEVDLVEDALKSNALSAEHLLKSKMADPVAAAVGAAALLRLGQMERLHDWTKNLYNWFGWLPDGAALYGEHLARLGEHEGAVKVFAEVPQRGLPVLADSFFYVYERLRSYTALKKEKARGVDIELVKKTLAPLERFAFWIHRRRALLSYRGLDPRDPRKDAPAPDAPPPDAVSLEGVLGRA